MKFKVEIEVNQDEFKDWRVDYEAKVSMGVDSPLSLAKGTLCASDRDTVLDAAIHQVKSAIKSRVSYQFDDAGEG